MTGETMEEDTEIDSPLFETRDYHPADAQALAGIYRAAILQTARGAYSAEQCQAWADSTGNPGEWEKRLQEAWVRVALTQSGEIAGFGGILVPGHIDLLFTAPTFNRQGVAGLILGDLFELAAAMGAREITVDASELSRPFFEQHGFRVLSSGTHRRGDQNLNGHHMVFTLGR